MAGVIVRGGKTTDALLAAALVEAGHRVWLADAPEMPTAWHPDEAAELEAALDSGRLQLLQPVSDPESLPGSDPAASHDPGPDLILARPPLPPDGTPGIPAGLAVPVVSWSRDPASGWADAQTADPGHPDRTPPCRHDHQLLVICPRDRPTMSQPALWVVGSRDRTLALRLEDLLAPLGAPVLVTDPDTVRLLRNGMAGLMTLRAAWAAALHAMPEAARADRPALMSGLDLWERAAAPRFGQLTGLAALPWGSGADRHVRLPAPGTAPRRLLMTAARLAGGAVEQVFNCLCRELAGLEGRTIGILGLVTRPDLGSLECSGALALCKRLVKAGAALRIHDPAAADAAGFLFPKKAAVAFAPTPEAMVSAGTCDALVLGAAWPEYSQLDWTRLGGFLQVPRLLDGCGYLDRAEVTAAGWAWLDPWQPTEAA